MYECYENIIGFTDRDCECQTTGRPDDYSESKSGLQLDELASIDGLLGVAMCDQTMWGILTASRNNAIKRVVADSNALLGKKYRLNRKPSLGQVIGQVKKKQDYTPTKSYAVVRVACDQIRGGVMRLTALGGLFNASGSVEVNIYTNVNPYTPIETITLNITTPNIYATEDVSLELPMFSKYADILEYYFVYEFDSNMKPKATTADCGCGAKAPAFNYDSPTFRNRNHSAKIEWANFVMVGGLEIDNLTELEELPAKQSSDMFGLAIEADFICLVNEVICKDTLDFKGNPLALSLAFTVLYATAINVGEKILKSSLLNREGMLNHEAWEDSITQWVSKYNEHINYIVSHADYTANDCLGCKSLFDLGRKGLFA